MILLPLLALLAATPVAEQPTDRIELAIRSGLGLAIGEVSRTEGGLGGYYAGLVPFILEGTLFFGDWGIGPEVQWGLAPLTFMCTDGVQCDGRVLRASLHGHYRRRTGPDRALWASLALGYEGSTGTIGDGSGPVIEFTHHGPTAALDLGADFFVTKTIRWGFFLSGSLGAFTFLDVTISYQKGSETIPYPSLHSWCVFGIRGVYAL